MYWLSEKISFFLPINYGAVFKLSCFENVLKYLLFSNDDSKDQQVQDYVNAVNEHPESAFMPGGTVCLEKSKIKNSFIRTYKEKQIYLETFPNWK